MRPRRLFGFDGTADEEPSSPTGFMAQRCVGLSSATASAIIVDSANDKLQGCRQAGEGQRKRV